mgnify:CR=1 FL=1
MTSKKVLEAYAYSILAKDAAGRWSNPRRALRSFEDIMEVANGQDNKSSLQSSISSAVAAALGAPSDDKPKTDKTAKDFYNFRRDQQNTNKLILAKLDALAPTP